MKTFLYRYIHLLIGIVIMTSIGIYGYFHTEWKEYSSIIPLSFTVNSSNGSQEIFLYQTNESNYFVFLPSYAKMEQVTINVSAKKPISIDNLELYDGLTCKSFKTNEEYSFKVGKRTDMTLQFCQSANVATMYINTGTKSMERIHSDKDYSEPSSMKLVSKNGETIYTDTNCYLKGRGNATWGKEKKPYLLKLSSPHSLLEMAPSKDWILLANSFDVTNLRNKIVYDLAAQTQLAWTPSCEYVDIYLNGTYNGLYLLAERIEADSNHLDIDIANGSFLCKVDHSDRWDSMRHPFKSSLGRNIEITNPKDLTPEDEIRIHNHVNKMEQIILNSQEQKNLSNIDLDSWVCKYLIDEISGNADSDLASSYFYYDNGSFYGGPIWDYDNSFGNSITTENPEAFIAKNYNKAPYYRSPYYKSLYSNEVFYSRVIEMYQMDFLPILNQLLSTGINSLANETEIASQMNYIRWQSMYDESDAKVTTAEDLIQYLHLRVNFLSSAWLEGVDYCTVQFELEPHGRYYNLSIKKGDILDASVLNTSISTWYHANTGETFDITSPITEDISLVQNYEQ